MRRLTILVAVLALIYSGYWFAGAIAVERAARDGLDQLVTDGWSVRYDTLNTRGFPSRFDTSVTAMDLVAPEGTFAWSAPFVQAMALSYQPNRVIAAFAETQTFTFPGQTVTAQTKGLLASTAVGANTALSLETVTAEVGQAVITSDIGWQLGLDRALFALRASRTATNSYDIYLDADTISLPAEVIALIDPTGLHPAAISRIETDVTLTFDRAIDRHSLAVYADDPLRMTALTLKNMTLTWGDMSLKGNGDIAIGSDGIPDGRITVSIAQWRPVIMLAANAGLIQPGLVQTVQTMGETLSQGAETLDIPITFQNGFMSVGPLPLGPAPRFY